jgi:hypothetical protein
MDRSIKMNEIKKERLAVLEEATRRMRESDYNEFPFADTEELIRLLKLQERWRLHIQPTFILQLIKDESERKDAEIKNKQIEINNQRIQDTFLTPIEFKIKVLEVELMLFNGIYNIAEVAEDIYKGVYPDEK